MISEKGIRALEVFNTLDAFKRREFKLVKEAALCVAVTAGTAIGTNAILPETIAAIPTAIVGVPAIITAFKKAFEADKVSNHADDIFNENSDLIMDYKLNGLDEIDDYKNQFPSLSKQFIPIKTNVK